MEENKLQDWKLGNDSKTHYLDRINLMEAWLKKNKQEILLKGKKEISEEEVIVGFPEIEI